MDPGTLMAAGYTYPETLTLIPNLKGHLDFVRAPAKPKTPRLKGPVRCLDISHLGNGEETLNLSEPLKPPEL